MSVWHEVQIELARDAADELILEQGEDTVLIDIRDLIAEAEDTATDLPEDNRAEAVACLDRSRKLLAEAFNKVPQSEEKPYRVLKNKLRQAQDALSKTTEYFLSMA